MHTCLSPCADLDMHPTAIVATAIQAGLDGIVVCDHNSAENLAAVQRAGQRVGLSVLAGMEIASAEEVHVVALLPDLEAALKLQRRVYAELPGKNDEEAFGMQVVAGEDGEVLGFNQRLLIGATTMSVEEVVAAIHDAGGVAVAAHVDREGFGIIGQLGMIPPGLALDALEVSRLTPLSVARLKYVPSGELPLLCGSDAHEPKFVGTAVTFMLLQEPTFAEVNAALAEKSGRTVLGGGRPMEDLSMHILDIAQNSIEAGASSVEISLVEDIARDLLEIEVRDDGKGMDPETIAKVADPFFTTRTTRKVGMGLAFLAQAAQAAGGELSIKSEPGQGTRVKASFGLSHIDRAPIGDVETTLMVLLAGHDNVDLTFRHSIGGREFSLCTADLKEAAGGGPLSTPAGLALLRQAIRLGESSLREPDPARQTRRPGNQTAASLEVNNEYRDR
ncbi:MAG: ATP-binding protein [Acidobacteriota bacterium]